MSTSVDYFSQAELAFASYAGLTSGIPRNAYINALTAAGLSSTQASRFASNWSVVDQYNDATNLSVTVFESTVDHKRYLAIRTKGVSFALLLN